MTKKRVLVADDDEPIRRMLCFMLQATGFEPVPASDGDDAFAKLIAGGFDVLVLDHMMPGRTGVEIARSVRSELPEPHPLVVMVTGGLIPEAARDLFDAVLRKPFDVDDLLRVLNAPVE